MGLVSFNKKISGRNEVNVRKKATGGTGDVSRGWFFFSFIV